MSQRREITGYTGQPSDSERKALEAAAALLVSITPDFVALMERGLKINPEDLIIGHVRPTISRLEVLSSVGEHLSEWHRIPQAIYDLRPRVDALKEALRDLEENITFKQIDCYEATCEGAPCFVISVEMLETIVGGELDAHTYRSELAFYPDGRFMTFEDAPDEPAVNHYAYLTVPPVEGKLARMWRFEM